MASGVAGWYYGVLTHRLRYLLGFAVVVLSAVLSFSLIAPLAAPVIGFVSITAAIVGDGMTYRIRPAFEEKWLFVAVGLAVLWDFAFWGTRIIVG